MEQKCLEVDRQTSEMTAGPNEVSVCTLFYLGTPGPPRRPSSTIQTNGNAIEVARSPGVRVELKTCARLPCRAAHQAPQTVGVPECRNDKTGRLSLDADPLTMP